MITQNASIPVVCSSRDVVESNREEVPSDTFEEDDVSLICLSDVVLQCVVCRFQVEFVGNSRNEKKRVGVDVSCEWFIDEFVPDDARIFSWNIKKQDGH